MADGEDGARHGAVWRSKPACQPRLYMTKAYGGMLASAKNNGMLQACRGTGWRAGQGDLCACNGSGTDEQHHRNGVESNRRYLLKKK